MSAWWIFALLFPFTLIGMLFTLVAILAATDKGRRTWGDDR